MKKILILEDNQTIQNILTKIIKKYFDKYNFQLTLVANGAHGLDVLERETTVDLIISDLNMPVMDGFEFIQTINKNPMWATIPVIVASAMNDQFTLNKLESLGVKHFVGKPYDLKILTQLIEKILQESEESSFTTNLVEEVIDFVVTKSSTFEQDFGLGLNEKKIIENFKNYLLSDLKGASNLRDLLLKYSPENELYQNGQKM